MSPWSPNFGMACADGPCACNACFFKVSASLYGCFTKDSSKLKASHGLTSTHRFTTLEDLRVHRVVHVLAGDTVVSLPEEETAT